MNQGQTTQRFYLLETLEENLPTLTCPHSSVRKTTTNSCLRKPLPFVPGKDVLDNLTPMDFNLSPQLDKQTKSLKNPFKIYLKLPPVLIIKLLIVNTTNNGEITEL